MPNYKRTLTACYLGLITQAIAANFAPLLFLTFHTSYNIPLGQIALISTVFFFTQLIVDGICAKLADRINYRKSIVVSEILSALGLVSLALLPAILPSPLIGILISVIIYAIGSGLIEVLCSPIVEACPFENKEATMSLLHSFYCWGCVIVIGLSTLFFAIFGISSWQILAVLWAGVPLYNIYNFATCPIEPIVADGQGLGMKKLLSMPLFWVVIVLMVCAGASEISMAQWASAYAESALHLSKTVGDLVGPALFAIMMGISRVIFGKYGEQLDLMKYMISSGFLCLLCYVLTSVSVSPKLGLIGCVVCGFSVGIMWPGSISISTKKIPMGGTAMFALLAMAGDLGGAIGPFMVGQISQAAGDNLSYGMLFGSIFPIILIISILILRMKKGHS